MTMQDSTLSFTWPELFAGATAGLSEHLVMFPFDTIKTRMQSGTSRSLKTAFRSIFRDERFAHLYRGCVPVLASAVPAHAAYFSAYEAFKRMFGKYENAGIAICACSSAAAHDIISTPFDVVKQRMQMDGQRTYKSSYECFVHILRREGPHALYVSLPTTVAMNIPHFATYWLVYESFMRYISESNIRHVETEQTSEHMFGGFLAGGAASIISFPMDTVKTQLQLGRGTSFLSTLHMLFVNRGISGIFSGVVARALYMAPSGAITMTTYETTKVLLS